MTIDVDVREQVRDRYAASARAVDTGASACGCCGDACGCCGDACGCCDGQACGCAEAPVFGAELYRGLDREGLPDAAVLASLGCGNPIAVAELREGETVLDLGSGGGIDVLLSAKRVGDAGKVYGLDMTDEMLALAVRNARDAGATNVEFLRGYIEEVPLPASTVDVVISNCVVNLSTDKRAVFAEMFRVLRPGGRIGITDVVAADDLTPGQRAERGSHVACIAGALSFAEYEAGLKEAGFTDITITATHAVADGMHSAIVRATKPPFVEGTEATPRALPVLQGRCC